MTNIFTDALLSFEVLVGCPKKPQMTPMSRTRARALLLTSTFQTRFLRIYSCDLFTSMFTSMFT